MKLFLFGLGILVITFTMTFLFQSAYLEYIAWKTSNLIAKIIKEEEKL